MITSIPTDRRVERAWVAHRGKQIAARTGCSEGIGQAEAMCELRALRQAGKPVPWIGKVTPIRGESIGMCGLYSLTTAREAVRQYFPKPWDWIVPDNEYRPSSRIGPSAKRPGDEANHRLVVRRTGNGVVFDSLRWRYETKWMRDRGIKVPINARSETIFSNGLFKQSARERRCLIDVDGFYEPKGPKGGKREQYHFTFPGQRLFALGGLWTSYKGDDDEFDGFIICTTMPNHQVTPIHPRMPVILDCESEWDSWPHGDESDAMMLCEAGDTPALSASLIE
jgi:putative SOS response-associated peptidase YedK